MDTVIITKIVTALLYPASIMLISGLFMYFFRWFGAKKLHAICWMTFVFTFLLSTNSLVARWLTESLERQYPQQSIASIATHDAIIVLGGGLRIPTEPAKQIQLGNASDRYWYAVQLYKAGKAKHIIVSGGNTVHQVGFEGEASYAKTLLELWGVPGEAIVVESESRNTGENQQAVSLLLEQNDIKSALLVTSAMHMPRASALFKALPIKITPASADVLIRDVRSIDGLDWIPSASAMELTTKALHEYYAIWYGRLKAFINKF